LKKYRFNLLSLFLITFALAANNNAQTGTTVIDSIKIIGNSLTEDFIILRELSIKEKDAVDKRILKFNKERIFSLGIFTSVELNIEKFPKYNQLNIVVEEGWYIYPVPFISRSNQKKNSYSYGINAEIKNFRGRNELLKGGVSFGYDPSLSVAYDNPTILFKYDLGMRIGLGYSESNNKNNAINETVGGEFTTKNYNADFMLYKRLNQFDVLSVPTSFTYIYYPNKIDRSLTASRQNIDRILAVGVSYLHDTRDLKQFPKEGLFLHANVTHKGFGITDINYNILYIDVRYYQPLNDFLFSKFRYTNRLTSNTVPFFDLSYLGYGEVIRGRRDIQREGNNLVKGSVELFTPILEDLNFRLKLPIIPKSLTSGRIGIYFGIFADVGTVLNNNNQGIALDMLSAGYGAGITILVLPYNSIRFEYAFGQKNKGEFSIDTGISF